MHCVRNIMNGLNYIGGSDRRLALFENAFPIPRGVSYNAFLLNDEKTVLFDTVDQAISGLFFENLEYVLGERGLDYVIISHMEPDHSGTLLEVIRRYPQAQIVCNEKAFAMIGQFASGKAPENVLLVKEGDTLNTGTHTLTFMMAPMVHWPEVMVTFDAATGTLFSADAFGTFGALGGNLYADELDFEREWLPDARRYYTNIVGKYGTQVQTLLRKMAALEIKMVCPLHGPIWRTNINWFVDKYQKWSRYEPEDNAVVIAYASIYGNTENAASILAGKLADAGVRNVAMYDVSVTHPSVLVAEAFRASHLVFASTTYNAGIFCNMETVLRDLAAHNLQKRTVAVIENGSWAPTAGGLMRKLLSSMRDMTILDATLTIKSSLAPEQDAALSAIAESIVASMPKRMISNDGKIERNALYKLSYGLFVLTAREGNRDNGCIINTVTQVTESPKRIQIAVNKANCTHDMIMKTGVFNVSVLTTETPFSVFQLFGFHSGYDTDKFAGFTSEDRTENGVRYIPDHTNACLSGRVIHTEDLGTHTVFTADITQAVVLSSAPSVTYQYYHDHIKPKPQPSAGKPHGYICTVCGWVYEGEELPPDIICPICKHGADVFKKIE
ncbi:MAG: flavin reductase [Clostridiaceae bacterium]|nr:flavin reductase [Clostridiaceae bacterium]